MNSATLTFAIVVSIAEIFGLMAVGGFARAFKYVGEEDVDKWSKLILDILFPVFIFHSICSGFEPGRLRELWPLPLIGFSMGLGGLILGFGLKHGLMTRNDDTSRTFLFFCAVNNYTYLPVVIAQNMWGTTMLANLFFLALGATIATWTFGVGVLGGRHWKAMLQNMLSPNLLAIIAGLLVAGSGLNRHIPKVADHVIASAGAIAVPMILILAGASVFKPSVWKLNWQVVYATIVRLAVLPAITIVILRLLPLSGDVYSISVIVALMPLPISSVIFTRIFGGDSGFAASASLVTTIAAMVTVPLALWLLFG